MLLFINIIEIAHDDAGRGKVAAYRQCSSLTAQLIFVIIIGVIIGLIVFPGDDFTTAIIGNVVCSMWVTIGLYLSYRALDDRKKTQERSGNVIAYAFGKLFHTFKEARKYLNKWNT